MSSFEKNIERGTGLARTLIEALVAPWGGSAMWIDAYENGLRASAELQLTLARSVDLDLVRSVTATCADLTRDVGATQVSSARWILGV